MGVENVATTAPRPIPAPTTLDPATIEGLPWHDLPGFDHVTYKLLWQSGRSQCGIMRLPPGAEVSPHVHQRAHHHIWVLEGSAVVLGSRVGPGQLHPHPGHGRARHDRPRAQGLHVPLPVPP